MTEDNLIERAVAIYGSEAKLAEAVGVSQPAINKARKRGAVSPKLALEIDRATGGEISKHQLRPDIFGEAAR